MLTRIVNRADAHAPRDPKTGVLIGAEARELGPVDADAAALFVHGYAGVGTNFNSLPERLAKRGWRVVVMRLPGHGTSPRDLENVSADELESAVLDAASKLRERYAHVIIIGHSMGGTLATLAAAKVPVDGVVLGGAYFGITSPWYYGMRAEKWTQLAPHVIRWVYKGQVFTQVNDKSAKKNIVSYTWLPTRSERTLLELGRRANEPKTLNKLTCPILMIHSHGDVAASPDAAEHAVDAMASKKKQKLWVDRSNHHVFWDYEAETVAEAVISFSDAVRETKKTSMTSRTIASHF